mgnify:CR=1 FL=1
MNARQVVEIGLIKAGMKKTALAEKLGWSPQLLNKRLNTGKLSVEEWETIAHALGAELVIEFKFPDRKEV